MMSVGLGFFSVYILTRSVPGEDHLTPFMQILLKERNNLGNISIRVGMASLDSYRSRAIAIAMCKSWGQEEQYGRGIFDLPVRDVYRVCGKDRERKSYFARSLAPPPLSLSLTVEEKIYMYF